MIRRDGALDIGLRPGLRPRAARATDVNIPVSPTTEVLQTGARCRSGTPLGPCQIASGCKATAKKIWALNGDDRTHVLRARAMGASQERPCGASGGGESYPGALADPRPIPLHAHGIDIWPRVMDAAAAARGLRALSALPHDPRPASGARIRSSFGLPLNRTAMPNDGGGKTASACWL